MTPPPARTEAEAAAADELASRMAELGLDLAMMVRDQDRAAVGEWLDGNVSGLSVAELRALLVMLAGPEAMPLRRRERRTDGGLVRGVARRRLRALPVAYGNRRRGRSGGRRERDRWMTST